jgi:hypothetical protein
MTLVSFDSSESLPVVPAVPKRMISAERQNGKDAVNINSSSHSVIQECPRKAKYLLHEKWRIVDGSPALCFGSGIHGAFETFSLAPPEQRKMVPLEELEMIVFGTGYDETKLLHRAIKTFVDKTEPLKALPDTDKRSQINGVWILWNYFNTHINDPYTVLVDEHGPFVEREFTFKLYEDDKLIVNYFGTIDAVKQHTTTKDIICVDYKTSSSISGWGGNGSFFDKEKPNSQYTGYLLGLREAFGIDINQFCIDIVEVKARPKTARGSPPSFPRQITTRDENDYEEFRESVVKAARDYLHFIATGSWPIGPTSSCNLWGACTYKQVCASPKSLRETILQSKFTRAT